MSKISMREFWKVGVMVFLLGTVLFVPLPKAQQTESQTLRIGFDVTDIKTLDPHLATGSQDRIIAEIIFNGLLRYKPGNQTTAAIEPDMAKAIPVPKILPDGRQQWIFTLKPGILYHPYNGNPGYELTSADVVYSFQKAADPKRSAFSADYARMTFEALDKYTVSIVLEKPISSHLFLPRVANRAGGLIVCKGPLMEKGDEWFKTHPVGTGPFSFKSYKPMEKVVLSGNKSYFRGAPKLAGIEFFFLPDVNSREMALQKGEVDVIKGPREQAWGEKVEKTPGIVVDVIGSSETVVAHFNMSIEPLKLLKVRQAIAYALNRREFLAVYGDKLTQPIYSPIPSKHMISGLTREECAEKNLLYEFNLNKAKDLLKEAGYPKGFSLDVFTSEQPSYKLSYELIQAQLRKAGIDIKLSVVDHSTFHTRIRQNLNPIVVYVCERPNPDVILTQFYHSESIVGKGKKPVTNFCHIGSVDADGDGKVDNMDDLIERARVEPDPEKQVSLWKEAQRRILQNMIAYPIVDIGYLFARKPDVDWGYKFVSIADGPKVTENTNKLMQRK
jgi:peptide/nickel transport system substrate-binding protein